MINIRLGVHHSQKSTSLILYMKQKDNSGVSLYNLEKMVGHDVTVADLCFCEGCINRFNEKTTHNFKEMSFHGL